MLPHLFDALRMELEGTLPFTADEPAAESTTPSANTQTPSEQPQTGANYLSTEIIALAGQPTVAQQYLHLVRQSDSESEQQFQPQSENAMADDLAREMLLAANGGFFNGSVANPSAPSADANTREANIEARRRREQAERRSRKITGISTIATDIDLSTHDSSPDDLNDLESQVEQIQALAHRYAESADREPGAYGGSFVDRPRGIIT